MTSPALLRLLSQEKFTDKDLALLLSLREKEECEALYAEAFARTTKVLGNNLYMRGLIEVSNVCVYDCRYCGIRKHNHTLSRYTLTIDEILSAAKRSFEAGYQSVALQSGERTDKRFVDFITEVLQAIHALSVSMGIKAGCGMTLSFGEQPYETYEKWAEASGNRTALRYLLRLETTNPALFRHIHGDGPKRKTLLERYMALSDLRRAGYQVGTGVMIGIPGQTIEDLVCDIRAFERVDADMFGMGPYIESEGGDMVGEGMLPVTTLLSLSLNMIAATRLVFPTCNMAAATALESLTPNGRILGVLAGCNVLMPNVTPGEARKNYRLYRNKAEAEKEATPLYALEESLQSTGRVIRKDRLGSSVHFRKRLNLPID